MDGWKSLLYGSYVSSGQALAGRREMPGSSGLLDPFFVRLIDRHLPVDRDAAIADVACGHGRLLACLKAMGYRNLQGVDISAEQVLLAHASGVVEARNGDMGAFLAERVGAFDVIFLMDILEHIERAELFQALAAAYSSLKEGGKIVIHVPNAEGIFGMGVRYGDLTHENCFTVRSMEQLLTSTGFRHIECYEDRPAGRGVKGFVRSALWTVLTLPWRLLRFVESGRGGGKSILSRNFLVIAERASA